MTAAKIYIAIILSLGTSSFYLMPNWQGWGWGGFGNFVHTGSGSCGAQVIYVSSSYKSISQAETKALIGWTERAGELGKNFAYWHNAEDRNVKCVSKGVHYARCVIKANPCPSQRPAPRPSSRALLDFAYGIASR